MYSAQNMSISATTNSNNISILFTVLVIMHRYCFFSLTLSDAYRFALPFTGLFSNHIFSKHFFTIFSLNSWFCEGRKKKDRKAGRVKVLWKYDFEKK